MDDSYLNTRSYSGCLQHNLCMPDEVLFIAGSGANSPNSITMWYRTEVLFFFKTFILFTTAVQLFISINSFLLSWHRVKYIRFSTLILFFQFLLLVLVVYYRWPMKDLTRLVHAKEFIACFQPTVLSLFQFHCTEHVFSVRSVVVM